MTTRITRMHWPSNHADTRRAEEVKDGLERVTRTALGTRASASLMLAAIVAALLVVTDEVIDTWTQGHLLVAWTVMWIVCFAALALFAAPARRAAIALRSGREVARKQTATDKTHALDADAPRDHHDTLACRVDEFRGMRPALSNYGPPLDG